MLYDVMVVTFCIPVLFWCSVWMDSRHIVNPRHAVAGFHAERFRGNNLVNCICIANQCFSKNSLLTVSERHSGTVTCLCCLNLCLIKLQYVRKFTYIAHGKSCL